MAASRAVQDVRGSQMESEEVEVDLSGVDFECSDVDFGKWFEEEEGVDGEGWEGGGGLGWVDI